MIGDGTGKVANKQLRVLGRHAGVKLQEQTKEKRENTF